MAIKVGDVVRYYKPGSKDTATVLEISNDFAKLRWDYDATSWLDLKYLVRVL